MGDAKRQGNGRFGPGNNANPGGRPAMSDEARTAFEEMEPIALENLRAFLTGGDPRMKMEATQTVIERRMGKATVVTDNTHGGSDGKPLRTLLIEFVDPTDPAADDEATRDDDDEPSAEADTQ